MNVNNDIVDVVEGEDGVWGEPTVIGGKTEVFNELTDSLKHGVAPGEVIVIGSGSGVGNSILSRRYQDFLGPDLALNDILNDDIRFMYPHRMSDDVWINPLDRAGQIGTSRKSDAHAKAKRKAQKKARAKNRK